jgi:hypothetical protein
MTLADFSPCEHEDKVKYMMVICLLNKTDKTRNDVFTTTPALSITVSMLSEPISSVTMMSTKESAPAREYNTAFKRATLMYAREKEKGKSSWGMAGNLLHMRDGQLRTNRGLVL